MSEFSNDDGQTPPAPARLISYAQNFEDIVLWRALREVEDGTYLDIGAAWPSTDSVTALFYERGWSGINVDPNPQMYDGLVQHRPRDINVRAAVSDHVGTMEFNVVGDTGLSTLDGASAERYEAAGYEVVTIETEVLTLCDLWRTHVTDGREVHFLKIDVEGAEEAVIRGADWEHQRPWVVVVESTLPGTQIETFAGWQPLLDAADYDLVYSDGLNRYYLAREHADLAPAFRYPPNVFDGFITAAHAQALDELQSAGAELGLVRADLDRVNAILDRQVSAEAVRAVPTPMRRLITVGLRALVHPGRYTRVALYRVKWRVVALRHARRSRPTLSGRVVRFAQRRPVCRRLVALLDRLLPSVGGRVHRFADRHGSTSLPESARGYLRLFDDTK